MDRAIVVAQSSPQGPSSAPTKVITVVKPQGEQAITIHLDGATRLDLSAIANESITLVHVGDRLIILFDNHSEVVIEPFFSDNGQPLPDITVELGPNHDVSGAEFASLFPITTDASVLPGEGGPGAISAGANFVSFSIDGLAPSATPLDLLGWEGANGAGGTGGNHENLQIVPMSLVSATITGGVDEGGFVTDTIGTIGNHQGAPVVASGVIGSLDALVDFGTGGPGAAAFGLVPASAANAWLANLGLTSHGSLIDTAAISGNTLVAGTDPAQETPHQVFSLTINGDGSWVFTLLAPLDDAAGQGANTATIDLSGLIQAIDAAGVTITFANDFRIVVSDDVPGLSGATASGSVEEAALAGVASPGDLFGSGNDPGHANGLAVVSGSLADLVSFGADGPAIASVPGDEGPAHLVAEGFQFAVATGGHDFELSSHGAAVDYLTVTGQPGAETLTAWTDGGAGHKVFTLTLDGDGGYTFTLINPLDQVGDDTSTTTLDLSSLVQGVDFDGDAVVLAGDFTITVANDAPVLTGASASIKVEEAALAGAASPGDQFGSGNDQAHHHGDAVMSGSLSGLVSFGADGPLETPAGDEHAFRFTVGDDTSDSTLIPDVTSHGDRVNFFTVTTADDGSSQTLTAWTTGGPDEGGHEVFTLELNGDGTYTFTLINPFDNTGPNGAAIALDLSAFVQALDFDGDAVRLVPGDFTVTVADDMPALTGSASTAAADEGGLRFGLPILTNGDFFGSGNDHGATTASGTLAGVVGFGADGPQSGTFSANSGHHTTTVTETIADGFQFVSQGAASTWLAALNLTSHGQAIDFAAIKPATSTDGTTVTDILTLTAWTEGGSLLAGGHEVFTLALNVTTGAWTFQLLNPIDDTTGRGTAATLDLSGLVQATDFDGDTISLSSGTPSAASDFTVTVADDAPVLTKGSVSGSVDEGGLRDGAHGGTDSYGTGNDHGFTIAAGGILAGSLNNDVSFGADGPALNGAGPLQLIANGFQFAVASGSTFDFHVKSHGVEVNYVTLSPQSVGLDGESQTLTAYAGQGGPAVFTLTLAGDGSWLFDLLQPLDESSQGKDTTQIDLSNLIKAVDFDGDSVTLSGDFKITVTDDVPVITGAASGSVFEAGLTSATDPFGVGNDAGSASFATAASGTLGIHFGADGPSVQSGTSETENLDSSASFNTFVSNQVVDSTTDRSHVGNIEYTITIDRAPGAPIASFNGAHGSVSGTSVAVADAAGPFVLESVSLGASTTSQLVLSGFDALGNLIASATVSVTASTDHLTHQVFNTAGTAFQGVQIAKLVVTDNDPTAEVFVDNVTAQTGSSASDAPLRFTDETTAANNITVTDGHGHAVALADLTSHGQALNFTLLSPTELVAYTGSTLTASDEVFTVTLSTAAANGSYDFVLHQPLDQALSGTDALNLTFAYTAQDFDGDTASGTFTVTDTDDVPVLTAAASGSVFEAGLATTGPPFFSGTDPFGAGNHAGAQGDPAAVSGTLGIHFGADGPAGTPASQTVDVQSQSDLNALFPQAGGVGVQLNTSDTFAVTQFGDFVVGPGRSTAPVAITDTEGPFTLKDVTVGLFGNAGHDVGVELIGLDAAGDVVASATVVVPFIPNAVSPPIEFDAAGTPFAGVELAELEITAPRATVVFNDLTVVTQASSSIPLHFTDETTAANNVTVTDANDHAVALTSHGVALEFALLNPTELVAYTGDAPTSGTVVFTVALSAAAPNGDYNFILHQPLDQPLSGADALNLTFKYTVQDFDGDTANGTFTVSDIDDAPMLTGQTTSSAVDEGALTIANGDLYGDGNDQGQGTVVVHTATLPALVSFGADGPAIDANGGASGFRFAVADGATVDFGVKSHGQEVNYVTLSAVSETNDGAEQTLTAWTNGGAAGSHEVFTLTLDGDGTYEFTLINPLDETGQPFTSLDLSQLIEAVDFDGDAVTLAKGDFTMGVNDDAPSISSPVSGSVSEAGLAATTDPFGAGSHVGSASFAAEASGSLGISFGADGPGTPTQQAMVLDSLQAFGNVVATEVVSSSGKTVHDGDIFLTLQGGHQLGSLENDQGTFFATTATVTDAQGPFKLVSLELSETGDASSPVLITGYDDLGHVVASATVSVPQEVAFSFAPTFTFDAAGTSFEHADVAKVVVTDLDTSSGAQLLFDGVTVAAGAVHFTDLATAANNVAVTDANGAVDLASLTSHGAAVEFALLDGSTLVAYTGAAPGTIHDANVVFSVALSGAGPNGAYDVVLDQPLDEPAGGGSGLDFKFDYTAQDFDGSTASGSFTVTATDDAPTIGEAVAGLVFEAGLTSPPDQYGSGSDAGDPVSAVEANNPLGITFGADGPATPTQQTLAMDSFGAWSTIVGTEVVSSSGNTVHDGDIFLTAQGGRPFSSFESGQGTIFATTATVTDAEGPFTLVSLELSEKNGGSTSSPVLITGYDDLGHVVASATVSVPQEGAATFAPTFTFDAAGTPFEHADLAKVVVTDLDTSPGAQLLFDGVTVAAGAVHFTDLATPANNVAVTDANGAVDLTTLTSHGAAVEFALLDGSTLVAYTGATPGTIHDANVVFSVALSGAGPNGAYDFVLDQPLDEPAGGGSGLDFTFNYTAQDFDGSTGSGSFTVTAADDAPVGQFSATISETGFAEIAMSAAFGADGPAATGSIALDDGISVTSAPDGETFGTPTVGLADGVVTIDPGTAFQELGVGESATLDIPYTLVDFDGSSKSGDLLVTVLGVNQDPAFGDGATSGTVTEVALQTGIATPDTGSGVITFTDVDYNDTHVATATYVDGSAVWSGASDQNPDIPAQTLTDLANALTAQVTSEATNEATGAVTWTASIPDQDLDFLAVNETLTATYNVTVNDNNGGSATEAVVVTFAGADDVPMVTPGPQGASVTEAHDPGVGTANLVFDPGFESGLNGWVLVTNDASLTNAFGIGRNGDGASFEFGQQGSAATLSQMLATSPGELYTVSFWLANNGGGTPTSFTASWGSQTLLSIVDGPAQDFTQYTFDVVGTSASTDLVFAGQDDPSFQDLDDVSVTPKQSSETASGTIAFTDPDLSDTHTVSVEPNSNVGTLTATLSGAATGGQTGTVDWTYTVSDSAIEFLAANQQQTETFKVDIDDGQGGVAQQDVVITLTGVNEAPVFTSVPEIVNTNLAVDGGFENRLSGWTLVASDGLSFVTSRLAHSGSESFAFGQAGSPATLSQTLATTAGQSYTVSFWLEDDGPGNVFVASWGNQTLLSLSNGSAQPFTYYTFNVTATGASTVLAFAGQNDRSFWHLDDVLVLPASTQTAAGQLTFTDPDLTDTHTFEVEPNSNIGTFTATFGNDATGGTTGTVNWTYSVDDSAIPVSLAANQTETLTYLVDVSDGHGGVATQAVNIVVSGINDPPVFTGGATSGTVDEIGLDTGTQPVTGSTTHDTTSGTVTYTDPDLTDAGHTASATYVAGSAVWSGAAQQNLSIPQQTLTDLAAAMTAHVTAESTNGATGQVQWTVTLPDKDLDFLAQGETLTASYNVTVSDVFGGSTTEPVTVTFNGANDEPVVTGGTASASIIEDAAAYNIVVNGGFEVGLNGWTANAHVSADTSSPHSGSGDALLDSDSLSDAGQLTQAVPTVVSQSYVLTYWAEITPSSDGTGGVLSVLWNGAQVQHVENFSDANIGQYQEFSVDVTGTGNPTSLEFTFASAERGSDIQLLIDDVSLQPVITAPSALGPSVLANGGFEGGLNGWTLNAHVSADTSSPHSGSGDALLDSDSLSDAGQLTQAVATVASQSYVLTYWAEITPSSDGTGGVLSVLWNGTQVQHVENFSDANVGQYQEFSVDVTGTGNPTSLEFTFASAERGSDIQLLIDDVSLQPVLTPAPAMQSGTITFGDPDLDDAHSATLVAENNGQHADGTSYLGTFSLGPIAGVDGSGSVPWQFTVDPAAIQFLAAGQVLQQFYDVAIADNHGGSITKTVEVDITGTNDPPVFTGGATSGSVDEIGLDAGTQPVTGSNTPDSTSGTVTYTDPDLIDTGHAASASYVIGSAAWSGGAAGAIPAQTLTDLAAAMTAQVTAESTNGAIGNVQWTVTLPDHDLDFLAQGETLTATYDVTVNDPFGGSATEPVTVTFNGANDAPAITGGSSSPLIQGVASTNLIVNGGFEQADANDLPIGWTVSGPGSVSSSPPHTGQSDFAGDLLVFNGQFSTSITQSVQTTAGQEYLLSFWAIASDIDLEVDWNGAAVATVTPPLTGYQEFSVALAGDGGSDDLSLTFFADNVVASFAVDDVSLQPFVTPAPTTQTTSGTVAFSDPDLNDTHTVANVAADGSGYLGTFTVGSLVEAGGSGSVPWTFTVDESAIQYLAAGQVLQQFYDVTIDDNNGGSATATVEVDIIGTDDPPVIAANDKTESASVQTGSGGTDATSGTIHFTDIDLTDRPIGLASPVSITYTDANGQDISSKLTQAEINAIEGAFLVSQGASNTNNGEVDWKFSLADSKLAFIGAEQSVTLTETVTVDDQNGGTDTATVTVTLNGLNKAPAITSAAATVDVTEDESFGTPPQLVVNGGFEQFNSLTEVFAGWTSSGFRFPPSPANVAHSGNSDAAVTPNSGLPNSLAQTITDEAGAVYKIDFFAIPTNSSNNGAVTTNNDLTATWDGATVVAATNVTSLSTPNPTSASQYHEYSATVVGTGSDTLSFDIFSQYYWFIDDVSVKPVLTPGTELRLGSIAFSDANTGDTHAITVTPGSSGYVGTFTPTLVDSTGTGTGAVNWTFSVPDSAIQFLAANQTVTQTYTIKIDDHHGGVTSQVVTVDLHGAEDPPAITSGVQNVTLAEHVLTGGGTITYTDPDFIDTHAVTVEPNSNIGTFTVTPTADSGNGATGSITWSYSVTDAAIASLADGQTLTQTYKADIDDHHGGVVTQPVSVTVTGVNDAPVITPGAQGGTVTQGFSLAVPTGNLVADGGFESQYSGWTVTSQAGDTVSTTTGHGGVGNAALLRTTGGASDVVDLSQSIATVAGVSYTIQFFVAAPGAPPAGSFLDVLWNGTLVQADSIPNTGSFTSFVPFSVTVPGTGTSSTLELDAHDTNFIVLDDVLMTANITPGKETAGGQFTYTDPDLTDTHTISVEPNTNLGTLTVTPVGDATNGAVGAVNWAFSVDDAAIAFLGANQTQQETFTVDVDDHHGGVTPENIVITLAGINDAPTITPGAQSGSVARDASFSTSFDQVRDGSFESAFKVWTAGTVPNPNNDQEAIGAPSNARTGIFEIQLETTVNDVLKLSEPIATTIAGVAYTLEFWVATRSGAGSSFNVLWNGTQVASETLVATGALNVYQPYFVTVIGTGTSSVLEFDMHDNSFFELDDVSMHAVGTAGTETTSGQITFTDPDTSDSHGVSVQNLGSGYVGAFTATLGTDSTGGQTGTVNWNFTASDADLSFLAPQASTIQQYSVTIDDHHGGTVSQTVSVTLFNPDNAPVIKTAQNGAVTPGFDSTVPAGELVLNGGFESAYTSWAVVKANPAGDTANTTTSAHSGNSAANIQTPSDETDVVRLSQSITTVAGVAYTIQFWASAPATLDPPANSYINVLWNGTEVAAEVLQATSSLSSYVHYSVVVMGTGTASTLELDVHGVFAKPTQSFIGLDDVSMKANVTSGVETTIGQITFTDPDAFDSHVVSVTPMAGGDLGTLSAAVLVEPSGSNAGIVDWTYSVSDAAIASLAAGQSSVQKYTVTINDGHGGVVSQEVDITINGANDAPVLSTNAARAIALNNEAATHVTASGNHFGVVGTLVSSIVGIGSGPNNVTDADSGAKTGIAITAVSTTLTGGGGTWFYSTNNGTNWTQFPTTINTSNALLLAADASTRIFFDPATTSRTGTATITFDAWDQTSGSNGGIANATTTGGSTAFSSVSDSAALTVAAVTTVHPLGTGSDTLFFVSGPNTVTATGSLSSSNTLSSGDSLQGAGNDTLSLTVDSNGGTGTYLANFAGLAKFAGFGDIVLATNPGNAVSLTFANANILSGQTIAVDARADTNKAFTADASTVNDGGNFIFWAGGGANTLKGGTGNDTFELTSTEFIAAPTIAGGLGIDTIQITDTSGVGYNLTDAAFAGPNGGVTGVEIIKTGGSGSVSLTLDAHAAADVGTGGTLTIDDSTGTGNLTVTATSGMTANLTVIAGSGTTDSLTGGSGNDTFELAAGHFHNAAQPIAGGAGSDTIWITDTTAITIADGDFNNVHGVEILKIGGSAADSVTLGSAASADVGGAGNTFTVDDSTGTGPLTLDASQMSANVVVDLASANFTASDTITGGSGSDTIALIDTTGIVVADAAFVNVTGVETLRVGGAADDGITLGANASHDVGGAGHLFTLDDSAALGNLTVDASAMIASLQVVAGGGSDFVTGGSGNDTFFAGLGNDIFAGGLGNNTFAFSSTPLGSVQITDFNNTTRADQIQVSAAGFGGNLTPNTDATGIFQTASNATFSGAGGGNGQFLFDTSNHTLYYSANGMTGAEHAIAQIEAGVTLTPHDIHVV